MSKYIIKKSKENYESGRTTWASGVVESPKACIIFGIIAIAFGILFIFLQSDNTPIPRDEAVSYSGKFQSYYSGSKYCEVYFEDGSCLDVYPHTEKTEFREKMESLEKGTMLYVLVNPNNNYIAEIKTDTEELLNFTESQEAIAKYDDGYVAIGYFSVFSGIFLIVYGIGSWKYKKSEVEHQKKRKDKYKMGKDDGVLRTADFSVKHRVLLETEKKGYKICYRRVKHTNELVVNGKVYDEKKGIIEFSHNLSARIDGNLIEAGYDKEDCSYIKYNGVILKRKKRYF